MQKMEKTTFELYIYTKGARPLSLYVCIYVVIKIVVSRGGECNEYGQKKKIAC